MRNAEFGIEGAAAPRLCGRGFASETRSAEAAKRKCKMTASTKYGKRTKQHSKRVQPREAGEDS